MSINTMKVDITIDKREVMSIASMAIKGILTT